MAEPRWLDDQELAAWRSLAALLILLPPRLDESTQAYGLTFFEYSTLVALSSAEDRTRPMSELANLANGSLSRTSHLARRLEERGFLRRHQCPDDGRVTLVSLTDEGMAKLVEAAPTHVEAVRQAVLDPLTRDETNRMGDVLHKIVSNIEPSVPWAQKASSPNDRQHPDPPTKGRR
jgi:DNA-binding MarR family transcriptional regulator